MARIGVAASEKTLYTVEATEDVLGATVRGARPAASALESSRSFCQRPKLKEYLRVRECSVWFHPL